MKPATLTIPFGGANFPKLKSAIDEGYVVVGERTLLERQILLRTEPVKGDLLCIRSYEDALYWVNGGFPRPDMYLLDKIKCLIKSPEINIVRDVGEKLKLGWCFLSCVPNEYYVLCKPDNAESYLCTEEDVEDYIVRLEKEQHRTSSLSLFGSIRKYISRI